ncbi:MAG: HD-GYP domain-containing protein [Lachnospiraceae bacterium]|nr:HD-GYP domain-containing protein [Lachnospiraceae bacterium]MCM1240938.1 HD-GYP domain-containing protein [Lachnospiraceae bacterium]MCM1305555.1 HD-GYP domain-containing protein [Butyrivibrio sp.]MCM1343433.1 HD-GYP domain-containing protein [Muribaculaceae bacterium]MCM1412251.1 HD-GYP domain-containing protein [Lachnospiraceae bacterium]
MVKRRYTSTRLLDEGMMIDQAIIDRTGRILIARKTVLDRFLIESLRKMGVPGVYIREGEEDPDEDIEVAPETLETIAKLKVADRAKVTLSDSVKQRVSQGIQFLYSDTTSSSFATAANNITHSLMQAITENDAVAMNIDALKISDEYTFKHSVDVATMAMIIARKSGLPDKDVYQIGVSGLLHDVGKSQIPNEILNKAGKLTEEEFAVMKNHTLFGYNILKEKSEIPDAIIAGVLQHHEKINGKGYPLKLSGKQITPYARVLSVADIYDALVTERPYKKGFSPHDALEMIMAMTDELDVEFMRSFIDTVILYPVDSTVTLSNGERARVVMNTPHYPMRPKVVGLKSGKVYDLANDLGCASIIIE